MIGIDAKIETLRTAFVRDLWKTYDYTAYHRAFLNERDEKVVPEILSSGNEYIEVQLNDNIAGLSFFVVQNDYTAKTQTQMSGTVNIYFAVNLKTLYPLISERALEYLHRDVLEIIKYSSFMITGITTGRDAFSDFDIQIGDNMQPFYLVKFATELEWNINQC